jgi:hypothetical protein
MTDRLPLHDDCPAKASPGSAPCDRHLVVARQDPAANGDSRGLIRLQIFNPDGSAWGPEITIDAATAGNVFHPAMAALADGRFAVAWEDVIGPEMSRQLALRVQVFNADGSPWQPTGPVSDERIRSV